MWNVIFSCWILMAEIPSFYFFLLNFLIKKMVVSFIVCRSIDIQTTPILCAVPTNPGDN